MLSIQGEELHLSTKNFFSASSWFSTWRLLASSSHRPSPVERFPLSYCCLIQIFTVQYSCITYQLGHIKNAALHVGIKLVEQTPPGPGDASEMFPVTQIMMSSIFVLSIGSCSLPRDNPPLKRLGNFSCLIREEKAYLQSATDNDPSLSCFHNN